jgi:hypothetical protein
VPTHTLPNVVKAIRRFTRLIVRRAPQPSIAGAEASQSRGTGISTREAVVVLVGVAVGISVGLTGGVGPGLAAGVLAAAATNGLLRPGS